MDELLHQIALTRVPGIGSKTAVKLLEHLGSARAVFETDSKTLRQGFKLRLSSVEAIANGWALKEAEREWAFTQQHGILVLSYEDSGYPDRLRQIPDPPLVLYFKGQANLNASHVLAIVGTRRPSPVGVEHCQKITAELSDLKPLIISGLAFGIDYHAHTAALQAGIATVGVTAHGLGVLYPPSHRPLAEKMMAQGGLLTEFPHHVTPEKEFFPMRNRIIAGLADGVLVIETAVRGGSMITANLANGYHREVLAIPGRPGEEKSGGCNLLIKNHQAHLVEGGADIRKALGWSTPASRVAFQQELLLDLAPEEKLIIDLLKEGNELALDELAFQSQIPGSILSRCLLELEIQGLVRSLPGNRYLLI